MDKHIHEDPDTHMRSFTLIRKRDKCDEYECKHGNLKVRGVAEHSDTHYKVVCFCEKCGKIYEFVRVDRRRIEE